MKVLPTELPEVLIIESHVYQDNRGFFLETYHAQKYRDAGIPETFVQDNHSRSVGHTLRGLHAQRRHPQGKLVRTVQGEIFDVAVDIRPHSKTFCQWVGVLLSAQNFRQLYIPPGFAHGFCTMSDSAEVEYKCTDFYDPDDEIGIRWNDPRIGIAWPVTDALLSDRDRTAPSISEILHLL